LQFGTKQEPASKLKLIFLLSEDNLQQDLSDEKMQPSCAISLPQLCLILIYIPTCKPKMLCDRRKSKKSFKRIFSFSLFFLPDQSMPNQRMEFHECCLAPTKPRKPISPINKKILFVSTSRGKKNKQTNKQTHIADEEVKPNLGSEQ
jgi:hypothetical protein